MHAGEQLAERGYQSLRQAIIRCELQPGSQVTEPQLVAECGLGRAAVRTALKRLYQEGLVLPIARKGYRIAPITIKNVNDLFSIRLLLEPYAMRLAVGHVDFPELQRLETLCLAGYQLGDKESVASFLRANTELHLTIVRASGNQRLMHMIAGLLDEMERFFHLGLMLRDRATEMYMEHKDLLEALIAQDGEWVEQISIEQIRSAQRMVIDALLASPSLQEVNLAVASRQPDPKPGR